MKSIFVILFRLLGAGSNLLGAVTRVVKYMGLILSHLHIYILDRPGGFFSLFFFFFFLWTSLVSENYCVKLMVSLEEKKRERSKIDDWPLDEKRNIKGGDLHWWT